MIDLRNYSVFVFNHTTGSGKTLGADSNIMDILVDNDIKVNMLTCETVMHNELIAFENCEELAILLHLNGFKQWSTDGVRLLNTTAARNSARLWINGNNDSVQGYFYRCIQHFSPDIQVLSMGKEKSIWVEFRVNNSMGE